MHLEHVFLDLGFAPISNNYLSLAELNVPECYYPLKLLVCDKCWLAQTEVYVRSSDLFKKDYAYFSSASTTWLAHARSYVEMISARLNLGADSFVIEAASNDGYLLKNFVLRGVPCLGVEPTDSTAEVAKAADIPVAREFFSQEFARKLLKSGRQADLFIGNNVYAHVPDINDFTEGMKTVLKPGGTITLEFPHLMNLINLNQFDTVYHEHYSYFSLLTVKTIFERAGLRVCDVEQVITHGGSLRVYGCHADDGRADGVAVARILAEEIACGLNSLKAYQHIQRETEMAKNKLLAFLIDASMAGKKVAAYGAAAKGNTLMNFAGVKPDLVTFVCDVAESKQGMFMPGSHIPIMPPEELLKQKPDYVIILPWNIADEVVKANEFIRKWGGKFVIAIPTLRIFS
jgi:hypothetical protein